MSIFRSNCTNGFVRRSAWGMHGEGVRRRCMGYPSRGMGYDKCREKESDCSGDTVFDKFGWSHEWIELGMKRCVGELE